MEEQPGELRVNLRERAAGVTSLAFVREDPFYCGEIDLFKKYNK